MDRFNYTQSFGDLGACSDLESLKTVLSSVIEALEKNGISPPPVNANTAAQQDADGNWKYPSSEPPRPWFRFKLTDVFSDGVAPAVVIDAATSELTPGEQVAVTDVLGFYNSGAADDLGYAMVAESTIPGKMQNEVWIMPGVGVPTGTDNYTVLVNSSDSTPEYLHDKFRDKGNEGGAPDWDGGTAYQLVYFKEVGSSPDEIFAYTAIGAGGADTDKLVACSPDDTAGYLEGKLANVTAEEYNSTIHMLVKWYTDNEGSGDEQMVAVVDRDDETGLTRVAEGDSLDYLGDQFYDWSSGSPGAGYVKAYADASSGTTLKLYATAHTETGKVRVDATDDLDYLEDQLIDFTSGYDTEFHWPVYFQTETPAGFGETPKIRAFIDQQLIVVMLTSTLASRSSAALGYMNAASETSEWVVLDETSVPTFVSQDPPVYVKVYNASEEAVTASLTSPVYVPAIKYGTGYLVMSLELHGLRGYDQTKNQSIGHNTNDRRNEWQDDGSC